MVTGGSRTKTSQHVRSSPHRQLNNFEVERKRNDLDGRVQEFDFTYYITKITYNQKRKLDLGADVLETFNKTFLNEGHVKFKY